MVSSMVGRNVGTVFQDDSRSLKTGLTLTLNGTYASLQQVDPHCCKAHGQRPRYAEQPDVDLFVGDAKKLSQLDQGDNCPIEYRINPRYATVCHLLISKYQRYMYFDIWSENMAKA